MRDVGTLGCREQAITSLQRKVLTAKSALEVERVLGSLDEMTGDNGEAKASSRGGEAIALGASEEDSAVGEMSQKLHLLAAIEWQWLPVTVQLKLFHALCTMTEGRKSGGEGTGIGNGVSTVAHWIPRVLADPFENGVCVTS